MEAGLKTFIFLLVFLGVIPSGVFAARSNPLIRFICFALMVYFTSWSWLIHIAPIPEWTGTARGFPLSMSDILAAIVLFSMILDSKCRVSLCPPGGLLYGIYFFFALLSGVNAIYILPWGFEIAKMAWMYLFFLAAYNYLKNTRELWPLVYVICATVGILVCYGIYQKYLGGHYQVRSTFPHQNSLTLYISLFGALLLGILLNEKTNFKQTALLCGAMVASTLLILFSFSRGGLAAYFWGLALTGILSVLISRMTPKKILLTITGIMVIASLTSYALPRIIHRFQYAPEASKSTRINLNKAAVRIANNYFFGVGANNFSEYSGPFRDYAREQWAEAKITEETEPTGGIVETIYLLVAAEFGWLGLLALLAWFFYYLILAARLCRFLRNSVCVGVAIGCTGGLIANYTQSLIEWSLKQYSNFYQLMLIFALVGVLWTERKRIAGYSQGKES